MEVILLDDIDTLGLRGEVVNVARGYARNFLLPRRLAEPATPAKVAELRKRDEQRARHEARSADQAQQIADVLGTTVLRFEVKAGPTGSLFGSVTPTNIADELWRTKKIRVDRRKIGIDTIKRIGRFEVPIELFQDVHATVNTHVVPEGGELPSEEELAAMEAQERGEPETPAAEESHEPTLEEALATEAPAVESAGARGARSPRSPKPPRSPSPPRCPRPPRRRRRTSPSRRRKPKQRPGSGRAARSRNSRRNRVALHLRGYVTRMREFLQTWIDAFHEHRLLTYATAMAMRAFIGFICLTFLGFALLGAFGDKSVWKKHIAPSIEPKVTQPTFDALNAAIQKIYAHNSAGLIAFAAAYAIWQVSGSIRAVMDALNAIIECDDDARR